MAPPCLPHCGLWLPLVFVCACTVPRTGIEASCNDGVQNQNETDVDCGGVCAPCPNEHSCRNNGDCVSGICDRLGSNACESAQTCGNGLLESEEACDDGDVVDNDGCNSSCLRELGEVCSLNVQCESGACDTSFSDQCVASGMCGNGIVEPGEACDGGPTRADVGCTEDCLRTAGQLCSSDNECASTICDTTENPDVCEPPNTCGNSKLEGSEACDDGNLRVDDGCNAECKKEDGQACDGDGDCASSICDETESPDVCEPANSCGNGRVEGAEACDDGNTVAADGCSAACLRENGQSCASDDECASGACDTMFTQRCVPVGECGNGILESGEACEDGNTDPGDGCDGNCLKELGETCDSNDQCASGVCDQQDSGQCEEADTCGNGVREPGEACDDGNTDPSDGCNAACLREIGQECTDDGECASGICDNTEAPNRCEAEGACGNGRIEEGEICDDGGTATGDGCSADCLLEDGEVCSGDSECDSGVCDATETPDVCEPEDACGNGRVEGEEGCDDGNTDSGDGCNVFCFIENGFECADDAQCQSAICDVNETPPVCEAPDTCGNGRVEGVMVEACDDGGTDPGDGCDASCKLESGEPCEGGWQCQSAVCGLGGFCV